VLLLQNVSKAAIVSIELTSIRNEIDHLQELVGAVAELPPENV